MHELTDLLGLGTPVAGTLRELKPGDVNPVWAVDTARGQWVIKTVRPAGPWWDGQARQAAALEQAAAAAGVRVPGACAPVGSDAVGLWSRVEDGFYARAMVRVDGTKPSPAPVDTSLAGWVGATLAMLEAVAPAVEGAWPDIGYATHPLAEWREWLGEAVALGRMPGAVAPRVVALVAELNAVVDGAVGSGGASVAGCGPQLRMLHRDVSRANILLAPTGPVLIDFDATGPQNPWWEAVGHTFALAAPEQGRFVPQRATVEAVLSAYHAAGGGGGAAEVEAFAGTVAARVSYAAFLLWNACGHRGGADAWQVRCAADFMKAVGTLEDIAGSMERWASWLG